MKQQRSPSRALALLVAVGGTFLTAGAAGAVGTGPPAPPESGRIIAGTVADPAAWPFVGALYIGGKDARAKEYFTCGATVISPRAALTAAHCISASARRLSLVVGRPNLAAKAVGREIPIRAVEVNPDYFRSSRADIAVLTLARDAGVAPAILPSVAQSAAATSLAAPLRVAGWGGTQPDGRRASKRLLTTGETVVDGARCKRRYADGFSMKTTICTQGADLKPPREGHAGACYGDSGGPLVADTPAGPLLVGAVSGGGVRCGTTPDYYTRISTFLPFIKRESGVVPPAP